MNAEASKTSGNKNENRTPSGGRGPGRPPGGGDSRGAILEAAIKIFVRDGLNASTRDIAAEAGITQAALYYYFPTKKDLLREAAAGASELFEPIGALAISGGTPEEVFRRLGESYLHTFAVEQVPRLMATMLSEGMKIPGFLPAMGERLQRGIIGPVIAYLETLRDEGSLSPDVNPAIVGQILFGTMFAFMMARHVLEAPWARDLDPAEVAAQTAGILVHGMSGFAFSTTTDSEGRQGDDEVA